MGFRNLKCFNKSLLAKQYWRLFQNLDSLAVEILKAKYFSNGSIYDAKLGSRSSNAWSIWSTQDLLKAALIWRVGDGERIKIWKDRWIPNPTSNVPSTIAKNFFRWRCNSCRSNWQRYKVVEYYSDQWRVYGGWSKCNFSNVGQPLKLQGSTDMEVYYRWGVHGEKHLPLRNGNGLEI